MKQLYFMLMLQDKMQKYCFLPESALIHGKKHRIKFQKGAISSVLKYQKFKIYKYLI